MGRLARHEATDAQEGRTVIARARGLTRAYGATVAVRDLDLEVHRGEVLALLGHNGAGKTTTVRLFNGVLEPTAGEVSVFGLSPLSDGPAVRARIGVLTESQSLEDRLSARQNLRYYAALYGYPEERTEARGDELLSLFGLSEAADRPVGGFSKGMRQKLALARALQHEPELLFLDEPTAGLDPIAARQVTALIEAQSKGTGQTVVLCTHNLAEAQAVADRVAVLRDGTLVALGTPSQLVSSLGATATLRLQVGRGEEDHAVNVLADLAPSRDGPGALLLKGVNRDKVPGIVGALVTSGVAVYAVEPQEPTLEDVYFAIYGESEESA